MATRQLQETEDLKKSPIISCETIGLGSALRAHVEYILRQFHVGRVANEFWYM